MTYCWGVSIRKENEEERPRSAEFSLAIPILIGIPSRKIATGKSKLYSTKPPNFNVNPKLHHMKTPER
jgi:hypothetical protein